MSLKKELRAEKVTHLSLAGFCQVSSGTPVNEVVAQMRAAGVNVCLILKGAQLAGILTDRDVLRKIAAHPETWDQPVDEVMTADPLSVASDTAALDALLLMDEKHFRNLPVLDADGAIVGNMTHQAVIKYLAGRYPTDILNLPPRPEQYPDQVEGG